MPFKNVDNVRQTTTITGSSADYELAVDSEFDTFENQLDDGDTCFYAAKDMVTGEWEVGVGTIDLISSPRILERTLIIDSSLNQVPAQPISWSSGTKQIIGALPSLALDSLFDPHSLGGLIVRTDTFNWEIRSIELVEPRPTSPGLSLINADGKTDNITIDDSNCSLYFNASGNSSGELTAPAEMFFAAEVELQEFFTLISGISVGTDHIFYKDDTDGSEDMIFAISKKASEDYTLSVSVEDSLLRIRPESDGQGPYSGFVYLSDDYQIPIDPNTDPSGSGSDEKVMVIAWPDLPDGNQLYRITGNITADNWQGSAAHDRYWHYKLRMGPTNSASDQLIWESYWAFWPNFTSTPELEQPYLNHVPPPFDSLLLKPDAADILTLWVNRSHDNVWLRMGGRAPASLGTIGLTNRNYGDYGTTRIDTPVTDRRRFTWFYVAEEYEMTLHGVTP
jgi:hypothetical protein